LCMVKVTRRTQSGAGLVAPGGWPENLLCQSRGPAVPA
jgi:hypothetical protein